MLMRKCCNTPRGSGPHKPSCPQNQGRPTNKNRSLKQALGPLSKRDRIDLLNDFAGDMPDGAYFAIAAEMGIDTEDFADDGGAS